MQKRKEKREWRVRGRMVAKENDSLLRLGYSFRVERSPCFIWSFMCLLYFKHLNVPGAKLKIKAIGMMGRKTKQGENQLIVDFVLGGSG